MRNRIRNRINQRVLADASLASVILATEPANLVVSYPCNELSGTVCDNLEGTPAFDGTYVGATLNSLTAPWGEAVPLFDGVNDFVNINQLGWDFDLSEMTFLCFVHSLTHASTAKAIAIRGVGGGAHGLELGMDATDWLWSYTAQSVSIIKNGSNTTTGIWRMFVMTVSEAADEQKCFLGSAGGGLAEIGVTSTGLTAWLDATFAVDRPNIMCRREAPDQNMHGYAGYYTMWSKALTVAQLQAILDASLI